MVLLERINVNIAANAMIILNLCLVMFDVLIMVGIVPYNIVWGGRFENISEMYVFEMTSIVLSLAIAAVIGIKAGYIKPYISKKGVTMIMWSLVMFFSLNTLGNIASTNPLETILFTPITVIATILCYRLAIDK
ncbi:MAG: hypothetical protein ISEC1_P0278 [Thiomicrorhabdus sp.]|nr:MAG: hypothetical protein ISEC1_P0278 [Thiomicrorhabdus sp.]